MYQGVTKSITCRGCSTQFTATSRGRLPQYCSRECHLSNGPKCRVCGSPATRRLMCTKHWAQWERHGGPVATRTCKHCGRCYQESAEGRGRARATCSDQCRTERTALKRNAQAAKLSGTCCTLSGCEKPLRSPNSPWCEMHYGRVRFNGEPGEPGERGNLYGEEHHSWAGDRVAYRSAHSRLTKTRGKASALSCVDCGRQAHHWSYDHTDADEKWELVNGCYLPFSTDTSRYDPRCATCHREFDEGYKTDGVVEFA